MSKIPKIILEGAKSSFYENLVWNMWKKAHLCKNIWFFQFWPTLSLFFTYSYISFFKKACNIVIIGQNNPTNPIKLFLGPFLECHLYPLKTL